MPTIRGMSTGGVEPHASTHMSGGSDPIKLDQLAAPTDVTTLNVSSSAHGLTPKLPNDATKYLDGTGAYSVPGGGAAGITTIASGSLPAAATLDITSISATYAYLILFISGASSNTATRELRVQASTDNGSTWDTTAGNYQGFKVQVGAGLPTNHSVASLIQSAAVAAANTFNAAICIRGYQTGPFKMVSYYVNNGTNGFRGEIAYIVATDIDALRILWDGTGNFDAGTYALYGFN